jgi:hypothetical protein
MEKAGLKRGEGNKNYFNFMNDITVVVVKRSTILNELHLLFLPLPQ